VASLRAGPRDRASVLVLAAQQGFPRDDARGRSVPDSYVSLQKWTRRGSGSHYMWDETTEEAGRSTMRGGSSRAVLRQLQTLYRYGVTGHQSDEQLLDRFVARRDATGEEAFAALVHRHGPMVLAVCRRVLGDAHEAEDAFQATFLILARKAASVVRREKVASWLYGVAYRTAKEARDRAARRRSREVRVSKAPRVEPTDQGSSAELRAILDQELARLPVKYRGPMLLCELEGLSRQKAAQRLGIPEGTLSSRLARAKVELRGRLGRRGYAVPAVVLWSVLVQEAGLGTLPDILVESTVGAAVRVAAGSSTAGVVSAPVVSLTEGVLKAMLLAKLKAIVLAVGTTAAVVSGSLVLAQSPPPKREVPPAAEDRTAAMERKLDKIIDALDHMTRNPIHTSNLAVSNSEPEHAATLARLAATQRETADSLLRAQVQRDARDAATALLSQAAGPQTQVTDTHALPLADRMELVERGLSAVQQRLESLEKRLAELDNRVGGAGDANEHLEPTGGRARFRRTDAQNQNEKSPEKPR
jgi:RNA polymerase sigma-70 factor (ECF subfamily)